MRIHLAFPSLALLLLSSLLFAACTQDAALPSGSIPVPLSDVPAQAVSYVQNTFAGQSIVKVEKKLNEDGSIRKYEVYLSNGMELYFDANWNPISDDSSSGGIEDNIDIPFADLPAAAQAYLNQQYPGASFKKIRKKLNDAGGVRFYEVRLEDGTKIYFAPDGSFAGIDD